MISKCLASAVIVALYSGFLMPNFQADALADDQINAVSSSNTSSNNHENGSESVGENRDKSDAPECLKNTPIGLCYSPDAFNQLAKFGASLNDNGFISGDKLTYSSVIMWSNARGITLLNIFIKNNTSSAIKDITIRCSNIAESGTVLGASRKTFYIIIDPNQLRQQQISVQDVDQQRSIDCKVVDYQ